MNLIMSKKGFTLIELLVVVAIIGILAAVGTVAYTGYIARTKDAVLKGNHDLVLKFLMTKSMECELGNEEITFKDASGNDVGYSCSSTDKSDFSNKILAHVNNHVCKNIYRPDRQCMEITGGYLEEVIAVDVGTGLSSCAIYIRTYVNKDLNPDAYDTSSAFRQSQANPDDVGSYGGKIFDLPSWC